MGLNLAVIGNVTDFVTTKFVPALTGIVKALPGLLSPLASDGQAALVDLDKAITDMLAIGAELQAIVKAAINQPPAA